MRLRTTAGIILGGVFLGLLPAALPAAPAHPGHAPGRPAHAAGRHDQTTGPWDKVKAIFGREPKEKPVAPVEELYDRAMGYFNGRETWFRRRLPFRRDAETGELRSFAVRHNYPKAIKHFQDIITYYPFSKYTPLAELRTADCHFAMKEFEEAAAAYEDFIKLHPVHDEIAYAVYRLGLCHYRQRRKFQRDQSETRAAILQFTLLRQRWPASAYAAEAEPLLLECRTRLAQHELYVGDFYFRRKDYWASAMRYAVIVRDYAETGLADRALLQEGRCYQLLERPEEARERYRRLAAEYADSPLAAAAQNRLRELGEAP